MSPRQEELRRRREALQWRCAAQRLELKANVRGIEANLDWVDRGLSLVRRLRASPYMTLGTLAALFILGPGKVFRMVGWASRLALLTSAYKKFFK